MGFWVKTNRLVKLLFPKYVWHMPHNTNSVYLTFDDGPTPEITAWILGQLDEYNAKATFFCIGQNIEKHPNIFYKIIAAGHAVGNHTYNHLKGWKTSTKAYVDNVKKCAALIQSIPENNTSSALFRPPYGKIKPSQSKKLRNLGYTIIMWDVISMDFDQRISAEQCLENVLRHVESGSIIVFHDSVKASPHLQYILPKVLFFLQQKGFVCDSIG